MAMEHLLLPGLPGDIALLCLARLPILYQARSRCVSKAWRIALHPSSLRSLRSLFLVPSETWAFLCFATVYFEQDWHLTFSGIHCLLLDPFHHHCYSLPPLDHPSHPLDSLLTANSFQALTAHGKILLHGLNSEPVDHAVTVEQPAPLLNGMDFLCFEVLERHWCSVAPRFIVQDRFDYAWSKLDNFIYVAGGRSHWSFSQPYKTAERFNLHTQHWEMLPNMKEKREVCSGFALNGCFYVIGDRESAQSSQSGEFFDPRTQIWVLVPQMWPAKLAGERRVHESPTVAVVNEQLYALKHESTEIFRYDRLRNNWVSVGDFKGQWRPAQDNRLVGVGEELWVVVNDHENPISVVSCKPAADPRSWTSAPFNFPKTNRYEKVIACVAVEV